jgi:hypothetical protein
LNFSYAFGVLKFPWHYAHHDLEDFVFGRKRGDDRFANGAGGAEDDDLFLVLDVGISDRIFLASKELDMVQMAQLHEPILEALERGDAKRAAQLLRGHSLGFAAQVGAPRPELTLPARKINR